MHAFYNNYFSKITEKQLVFFWLMFCLIALTYKLGGVPPYHTDENFYVESSRNMVESGDYLTPIYNDKKRFAKPILYYWLVSTSYKIFGVNLTSARLTSAFFGSLTIGLLYLVSRRWFDGRTAFYSIMILPSTFLYFQIARWATTDIVMNFFILLGLYYFILAYQNDFKSKLNIYLFYLSMALGFMIKGPPAIIIPALVAAIFLAVTRRLRFLGQLRIGQGLLIFGGVIIPWFAMMVFLHGDEFTSHIVGAEIEGRLVHNTPFSLYYFGVLIRYHLPWSLFFLIAVFNQFGICSDSSSPVQGVSSYFKQVSLNFKARFRLLFTRENEPVLFCYIWILVCLILFTLVRIEHSRYMLPASSALAILTAKFFADMENIENGRVGYVYKVAAILTGVALLVIALLSCLALIVFDLINYVPLGFYFLPAVLFLGGFCVIKYMKTGQYREQIFSLSLVLVFSFSFLSGDILSHASLHPMKIFSEKILSEKFTGPIGIYRLGNNRARLGVLTGQKVSILYLPGDMESFLKTDEEVRIVIREEDFREEDFREKFPDSPLEIVAEDIAWLEGRIGWEKLKELLGKAEREGFPSLTEKIYLLSNK
jgi:4-amino-4-deoxy-L-arabinose transferase-like glycosyltransferase